MEAGGPLQLLLAQFAYFGQPFLGRTMPTGQWEALTQLLEDEEESRLFAAFLREENFQ